MLSRKGVELTVRAIVTITLAILVLLALITLIYQREVTEPGYLDEAEDKIEEEYWWLPIHMQFKEASSHQIQEKLNFEIDQTGFGGM